MGQCRGDTAGGRRPRAAGTGRRGRSLGKGWKCGVKTKLKGDISSGALQGDAWVVEKMHCGTFVVADAVLSPQLSSSLEL